MDGAKSGFKDCLQYSNKKFAIIYHDMSAIASGRVFLSNGMRRRSFEAGGGEHDRGVAVAQGRDGVTLVYDRVVRSQLSFVLSALATRSAVEVQGAVILDEGINKFSLI